MEYDEETLNRAYKPYSKLVKYNLFRYAIMDLLIIILLSAIFLAPDFDAAEICKLDVFIGLEAYLIILPFFPRSTF